MGTKPVGCRPARAGVTTLLPDRGCRQLRARSCRVEDAFRVRPLPGQRPAAVRGSSALPRRRRGHATTLWRSTALRGHSMSPTGRERSGHHRAPVTCWCPACSTVRSVVHQSGHHGKGASRAQRRHPSGPPMTCANQLSKPPVGEVARSSFRHPWGWRQPGSALYHSVRRGRGPGTLRLSQSGSRRTKYRAAGRPERVPTWPRTQQKAMPAMPCEPWLLGGDLNRITPGHTTQCGSSHCSPTPVARWLLAAGVARTIIYALR